jgi:hypothetical protein
MREQPSPNKGHECTNLVGHSSTFVPAHFAGIRENSWMVVLPGLLSQQLATEVGEDPAAPVCLPGQGIPYRVWDVAGECDFDPNKLNAARYLSDLISMRQLWRSAASQGRNLLCLLFPCKQTLSIEAEGIG